MSIYLSIYLLYIYIYIYIYIYVTGMEIGLWKRQRGLDAFIAFGDSSMDTSRCAEEWQCFQCACTVVFPLEDQSRWLWHHEMMSQWSLMLFREGTIKAHPNLQAVIWVFQYWSFGSINKPQTLYFSYIGASHRAEHNQNELCDLFIYMHVPRPFWGTFGSVWL